MLLRSITKHVKDQNWFAVALDFFIVVAGILIAFQITNWSEARREVALQLTYTHRLESDFERIRQRLEEHVATFTESVSGTDYILSLALDSDDAPSETKPDEKRLARAVSGLFQERVPPPMSATYLEMVSEGKLSGLRDDQLRDKLAEYVRLQSVVQALSGYALDNNVVQTPILQRYFVSKTVSDDMSLSGVRDELLSYDIDGMRADPNFIPALNTRHRLTLNTLQLRKTQIGLIDEILALLAKENDR